MKSMRGLLLMVLSGMLSACNSLPHKDSDGIQLSFEQLGAGTATRNTDQGLDVRTALSVTGLNLPTVVGQNVMSPGKDNPDLMAIPTAGMCSRIVVTSYDTKAGLADVMKIKNQLDAIQQQTIKVLSLQARKQLADIGVGSFQNGSSNEQLNTISRVLGVAGNSAADFQTAQATISSALDKETSALQSALADIKTAASQSGVMVARWSSSKQDDTKFAIGTVVDTGNSEKRSTAGYVVIAGIRDASLQIGMDFITRLAVEKTDLYGDVDVENIFDSPYIETFSRSVKHIAYSEQMDVATAFSMSLKLTPKDIESLLGSAGYKILLMQQQFTLDYINAAVSSASNQGVFSEARTEAYPFTFWPRPARAKAQDLERARRNGTDGIGWKDIYSNRVTLIELKSRFERYSKNAVGNAQGINDCSYVVPKSGAYNSVAYPEMGTTFCWPKSSHNHWRSWAPSNQCMDFSKDSLLETQH